MKKVKKITKKAIVATLRTLDRTAIFKLCKQIYPGRIFTKKELRSVVYDIIKEFAPTNKIAKEAYWLAYTHGHQLVDDCYKGKHGYFEPLTLQMIVDYTKQQLKKPVTPYTKYPTYGHTHLYFCSPTYGHSDYNKWRALPIEGNEKFCKTLIQYVENVTKIYNATIRVRVWQRRTNDYEKEKFDDKDYNIENSRKFIWARYREIDAKFARQNADYTIGIINNENQKSFWTDTVIKETFYELLTKIN